MTAPLIRPALLLLDFDDVLADFNPRARNQALAHSLSLDADSIASALAALGRDAVTGSDPQQLDTVLQRLQQRLDCAISTGQWHAARMAATTVRRDCRQLLLGIAPVCPLAILSNNPAALAAPIAMALDLPGLDSTRVLTAGQLGLHKPDPACFTAATAQLGADPARTLFIDNLFTNVRGARSAGLMADTAHHAQSLRRVLKRHHLLR
ncbi:hypothetical protein ABB25_11475 [Stenotrophomonas koreensis]|uniref:Hydrolase n=1 Tax=Stenotrophomonas koreensis TaxID=266128 RepID=A0A0R0BE77_9GAMM|nr:HAD-IA family hydrolase [Stenotrophomonas koreensis]KRG55733.1 hypothetical protein ABB25_11475 [Stenotrophomonas koreensis]